MGSVLRDDNREAVSGKRDACARTMDAIVDVSVDLRGLLSVEG